MFKPESNPKYECHHRKKKTLATTLVTKITQPTALCGHVCCKRSIQCRLMPWILSYRKNFGTLTVFSIQTVHYNRI